MQDTFIDRLSALTNTATAVAVNKSTLLCCINPGCQGLFQPDPQQNVLCCILCATLRCSKCPYPPHESLSCDELATLRANEEESIERYMKEEGDKVKKCPGKNCNAATEKKDGCNHMECPVCGIHYCWVCLFTATAQNVIYQHMVDEHGTTGGDYADYIFEQEDDFVEDW